ncbi:MAG: hypothetical protein H0U57_07660 [Tatlockia sp.]|nr:hypothetical protein [Tatlockia sp.]
MTKRAQTLFEQERNKATQIYQNIKNKLDASAPELIERFKKQKYRVLRQVKG